MLDKSIEIKNHLLLALGDIERACMENMKAKTSIVLINNGYKIDIDKRIASENVIAYIKDKKLILPEDKMVPVEMEDLVTVYNKLKVITSKGENVIPVLDRIFD